MYELQLIAVSTKHLFTCLNSLINDKMQQNNYFYVPICLSIVHKSQQY